MLFLHNGSGINYRLYVLCNHHMLVLTCSCIIELSSHRVSKLGNELIMSCMINVEYM